MTDTQQLLACQFPASAEHMGGIRLKLREALGRTNLADSVVDDIVLAAGEACMNIMQHAYSAADKGDIVLEIELQHVDAQNDRNKDRNKNEKSEGKSPRQLVIRLTDFARHKSSVAEMQPRPLDEIRPGGLGCHIISQVMDEVVLLERPNQCGNVLELRKHL